MSFKTFLIVAIVILTGLLTWRLTREETIRGPALMGNLNSAPGPSQSPKSTLPQGTRENLQEATEGIASPSSARPSMLDRIAERTPLRGSPVSPPDDPPLKGSRRNLGDGPSESRRTPSPVRAATDRLWDAGYVEAEAQAILQSWQQAEAYAEARHGPDPINADNPPPQFHEAEHRYDAAMRSQMSDADYDAARYANDLTNRVEITHLPAEPELALEGLMEGDLIRSVNGEAVYTVGDFMEWRRNNREALPLDPAITVERPSTGETFQIRSPMARVGILENVRVAPTPP